MTTDTLGTSIRDALGQDSKEATLKHIDETWDKEESTGQKIHDFLFAAPTGKSLGLPPSGKKLSKDEAMKLIEQHWEHPFHQPQATQPHGEASTDTRTAGEKAHDFFLTVPTGKSLGLPQTGKKLSKDEAMQVIEEHWEHPFVAEGHTAPEEEEPQKADDRKFGQKLYDFLFKMPTEENLGLPQEAKMSKAEAMKAIEQAWDHPLNSHVTHP